MRGRASLVPEKLAAEESSPGRMAFDIFSTQDVNAGGIIVAAVSLLAASLWLTASWPTGRLDWPLLAT